MKFFEKLKFLRAEKEITQQVLSVSLNLPRYLISNWEQGRSEPSMNDLIKLADFFECTVDYLLGREDDFGNVTVNAPAQELTYREKRLLKAFSSLSDNIQDKLIDDAEFYAEQYAGESKYNKRA